ncbi:MAG TPA: RDD family protein [Candidatus Angelobacter sp.]|nr:RDD family protein [Candidatus Angelobacter sp.]
MAAAVSAVAPPPQTTAMAAAQPLAMQPQSVSTAQVYAQPVGYTAPAALPYAGFWMRVGAYLLDIVILVIPLFILSLLPLLGIVIDIVGIWLYFALQESSERQATIGKRALNIYVTDLQGRRISFGQATGRHFSKIISSIILGIGYMMAGFTEKKQALHDMIAGTLIKRR